MNLHISCIFSFQSFCNILKTCRIHNKTSITSFLSKFWTKPKFDKKNEEYFSLNYYSCGKDYRHLAIWYFFMTWSQSSSHAVHMIFSVDGIVKSILDIPPNVLWLIVDQVKQWNWILMSIKLPAIKNLILQQFSIVDVWCFCYSLRPKEWKEYNNLHHVVAVCSFCWNDFNQHKLSFSDVDSIFHNLIPLLLHSSFVLYSYSPRWHLSLCWSL